MSDAGLQRVVRQSLRYVWDMLLGLLAVHDKTFMSTVQGCSSVPPCSRPDVCVWGGCEAACERSHTQKTRVHLGSKNILLPLLPTGCGVCWGFPLRTSLIFQPNLCISQQGTHRVTQFSYRTYTDGISSGDLRTNRLFNTAKIHYSVWRYWNTISLRERNCSTC